MWKPVSIFASGFLSVCFSLDCLDHADLSGRGLLPGSGLSSSRQRKCTDMVSSRTPTCWFSSAIHGPPEGYQPGSSGSFCSLSLVYSLSAWRNLTCLVGIPLLAQLGVSTDRLKRANLSGRASKEAQQSMYLVYIRSSASASSSKSVGRQT